MKVGTAVAISAAVMITLGACSGETSSESEESTVTEPSDAPPPADTSTVVDVTPTTTDEPSESRYELPHVGDQAAAATLSALQESDLGAWVDESMATAAAAEPPCDPSTLILTTDQLLIAARLRSPVTAELILDLDASLGAAAEWCRRGDADAAATELRDAATTAAILDQQLEELER